MKNKRKILIIFSYVRHFKRLSGRSHLDCFKKYSDDLIFYHNIERYKLPKYLLRVKFDLIIFHTSFLANRYNSDRFIKNVKKCKPLIAISVKKAILPQDEHYKIDFIIDFIKEQNINYIFTVSPKNEWKVLYGDLYNLTLIPVLTGYIDSKLITEISHKKLERHIDIGYRVGQQSYAAGKQGNLKIEIADLFNNIDKYNFKTDISTDVKDTFLEGKWLEFLLKCRYTIGVESGSSILDRDGNLTQYIDDLQKKSDITFQEFQYIYLKNDEEFKYYASSPRHLEACLAKTCQILVEGEYDFSSVLMKDIHYISLKRDFSNIEEVLVQLNDEDARVKMVNRAYNDIVLSNKYTYDKFVDKVLIIANRSKTTINDMTVYYITKLRNWYFWKESNFLNFIGYYK